VVFFIRIVRKQEGVRTTDARLCPGFIGN